MLLISEEYSAVASVTDELSLALAEGRDDDSLSMLLDLREPPHALGMLILAWADLLALRWVSSDVVFSQIRQTDPDTPWLPYAETIVDSVGIPGSTKASATCITMIKALDDPAIYGLLSVMAQLVRHVLDTAGGLERLRRCAALHHLCAGPQLSAPAHYGLISPAAWIIAANSAGHYEQARDRCATLASSTADAIDKAIALWLQVTARITPQTDGTGTIIEVDPTGTPLSVVDPESDHPAMAQVTLIQDMTRALQEQDAAQLGQATRAIAALAYGEKITLSWQLARMLGMRVSQFYG